MKKINTKDEANYLLGKLNSILREQLIDTKQVSIPEWNKLIAPTLKTLGMIIDKVNITARTFRLPENYWG